MQHLIAGAAIGALIASAATAQVATQDDPYNYNPSAADVGHAPPTDYEGPAPANPSVAPFYVPGLSGYGRQAWPGETSPGADTSVRLRGLADPTTSVTAMPNPNNASDQVPSRGPDVDGPPPGSPY